MTLSELTIAIQRRVGAYPDGIFGPKTATLVLAKLGVPLDSTGIDERSIRNIELLHPQMRPLARTLIRESARLYIDVRIISSLRTYEEQDAIYGQGRSLPGKIVTNAKAGYSWHNFGCAFDIGIFIGETYIPESPFYKVIGEIGEKIGLEWGGRFVNFPDEPHFQLTNGKSLAQARELHAQGKTVFDA